MLFDILDFLVQGDTLTASIVLLIGEELFAAKGVNRGRCDEMR